jgi:hypothetical protein
MSIWLTTTVQVGNSPKIPSGVVAFEDLKEGDLLEVKVGLHRLNKLSKSSVPDTTFTNLSNPLKPKHLTSWYLARKYALMLKLKEVTQ